MLKCVRKQRQEQAQESRRKLMDAALTLFAQKGYAGTNMRAISRSAGMADGLLYHYFPGGKQELLREIVREKLGDVEMRTRQWDTELMNLSLEEVPAELERMNVVLLATESDFWDNRYYPLSTLAQYLESLPEEQRLEVGGMRYYLVKPELAQFAQAWMKDHPVEEE